MITEKDVNHIALLSRLSLSDEEREKFTRDLNSILEYIEKLQELDTEKVLPTSHPLPMSNVFREDRATESLSPEQALQNAPEAQNNCFRVPKVIH